MRPQVRVSEAVTKASESKTIDNTSMLIITAPESLFEVGEESKSFEVLSLKNFEDLAYKEGDDLASNMLVWEHVNDFYKLAGDGVELHVLLLKSAVTLKQMFTLGNSAYVTIESYLQSKKGRVRMVGVATNPDPANEVYLTSIDLNLKEAIPLAQNFCNKQFTQNNPILICFESRKFAGTALAAEDLTKFGAGNIAVMIGRDEKRKQELWGAGHSGAGNYAAVGVLLGRLAGLQVSENIGRTTTPPQNAVRENLPILKVGFSGGQAEFTPEEQDVLHAKGYIFFTEYSGGYPGIYFVDDRTCQDSSLSNSNLAAIRVTNKCAIIAYNTYMSLLKSTVSVDKETGRLPSITITSHVQKITDAIEVNTKDLGTQKVDEISGIEVVIDPLQNILEQGTEDIELRVITRGTLKNINVLVGLKAV